MSFAVHISGPTAPPGVEDDPERDICCIGAVMRGAAYCTCWEAVFDLEQAELDLATQPTTRAKCCYDCAYRVGSREREAGEEDRLTSVAFERAGTFWCHQGVRRAIAYRHPDGREVHADDGDYQPPIQENANGVLCVWLADGSAGERCAGWSAVGGRDG